MRLRGGRLGVITVALFFALAQASLAPAAHGPDAGEGSDAELVAGGAAEKRTVAIDQTATAVAGGGGEQSPGEESTAGGSAAGDPGTNGSAATESGTAGGESASDDGVAAANGTVANGTATADASAAAANGTAANGTAVNGTAMNGTAANGTAATAESGVRVVRADRLHELGITGEGVRVGVIDEGFDPQHPAIADRVAADRRFDRTVGRPGTTHGTAVAEIVADTAPNATLYLASVGDRPAAAQYDTAVEWLIANDVDVIVDSGSYFPHTVEDADRITAAAERASDSGVVFVTSAGNYADRHWTGNGTREGWVEFAPADEVNFLNEGNRAGGTVSLRLRWNSTADYDLYVYRYVDGRDPVVAKSVRRHDGAGTRRSEAIDAAVPEGRYYVAIYAHNGTDDPGRVSLFSPRQSLEYSVAAGSVVAPATSERVISVAALEANGSAYGFSSVGGGTADVDLGAPGRANLSAAGTFVGSSAAAPYVAGTVALMTARNESLTPERIETVLEATARPDGRLDAFAAVANASASPLPTRDGGETGAAGEPEATDGTATSEAERTDGGAESNETSETAGTPAAGGSEPTANATAEATTTGGDD